MKMNKIGWELLFMASCLLLCGGVFCQDSPAGDVWEARIVKVKGEAYILTNEDPEQYYPALIDTPLEAGDTLQTGADGSCEIMLESGNLIRLDKDSEFNLTNLQREKSALTLTFGGLLAKLTGLLQYNAQLELRTPTAVAAVRGTELAVESYEKEAHIGVLDEGKVAVKKPESSEEVLLTPGKELVVHREKALGMAGNLRVLLGARKQMQALRKEHQSLSKRWHPFDPQKRRQFRKKVLSQVPVLKEKMNERVQAIREAGQIRLEKRRQLQEQMESRKEMRAQMEQERLKKQQAIKQKNEMKNRENEMRKMENQRMEMERKQKRKLRK